MSDGVRQYLSKEEENILFPIIYQHTQPGGIIPAIAWANITKEYNKQIQVANFKKPQGDQFKDKSKDQLKNYWREHKPTVKMGKFTPEEDEDLIAVCEKNKGLFRAHRYTEIAKLLKVPRSGQSVQNQIRRLARQGKIEDPYKQSVQQAQTYIQSVVSPSKPKPLAPEPVTFLEEKYKPYLVPRESFARLDENVRTMQILMETMSQDISEIKETLKQFFE